MVTQDAVGLKKAPKETRQEVEQMLSDRLAISTLEAHVIAALGGGPRGQWERVALALLGFLPTCPALYNHACEWSFRQG